jgi:hypothetical protein
VVARGRYEDPEKPMRPGGVQRLFGSTGPYERGVGIARRKSQVQAEGLRSYGTVELNKYYCPAETELVSMHWCRDRHPSFTPRIPLCSLSTCPATRRALFLCTKHSFIKRPRVESWA